MIVLTKKDIEALLRPPELIDALRDGFAENPHVPDRWHLGVREKDQNAATLLLMPAWNTRFLGVKIATIFPGNSLRGIPAVEATYLLKSGETGELLAILDGSALTTARTAATSALASSFLSRADSRTLLMVGAGALSRPLIQAHRSVRSIERIILWNRNPGRAKELAETFSGQIDVEIAQDLDLAVAKADIVSCATLSSSPLVCGRFVRPGTHIDLVGAYLPTMRESDSQLMAMSHVFVDTRLGALKEAGDLILAEREGRWSFDRIEAELTELCQKTHPGRQSAEEITVFKSVGASLEDLVAASLAYTRSLG